METASGTESATKSKRMAEDGAAEKMGMTLPDLRDYCAKHNAEMVISRAEDFQ
jgi:membrane-bound lytic murein transglycosylase